MQFRRKEKIRIRFASELCFGLFFAHQGIPFTNDCNVNHMFTAPLLRQDRSVPGDRIDGTLGSILFSQREFNGWLEQKPFIPTQEYVAGCRQREKIGFNDVFLHIWKGSAPELWTSGIEWTTFYGSFLKRYIQNLAGLPSEQDFFKEAL